MQRNKEIDILGISLTSNRVARDSLSLLFGVGDTARMLCILLKRRESMMGGWASPGRALKHEPVCLICLPEIGGSEAHLLFAPHPQVLIDMGDIPCPSDVVRCAREVGSIY